MVIGSSAPLLIDVLLMAATEQSIDKGCDITDVHDAVTIDVGTNWAGNGALNVAKFLIDNILCLLRCAFDISKILIIL